MEPLMTRCGYRCDLCLAYEPNITAHPENQAKLSDGWFKYFGFRIPPDQIHCAGCLQKLPRLIDQSCPVRPCVIQKEIGNCTECEQYICEKLKERLVTLEEVKDRIGQDIPVDDYVYFILPYENKRRLEVFRMTGKIID